MVKNAIIMAEENISGELEFYKTVVILTQTSNMDNFITTGAKKDDPIQTAAGHFKVS